MGKTTGITWTDHTFNPWWGCIKVSPGCERCYAETFSKRTGWDVWGPYRRRFFGNKHWEEPVLWNKQAEQEGKRHKVFCASMADVFENFQGLDEQRARLWELIEATPYLDWQLCTKRPENIDKMLPVRWSQYGHWELTGNTDNAFPQNIWLGTTTENQDQLDRRWPVLEWVGRMWYVPVIWISAEPLLSPLDLSAFLREEIEHEEDNTLWTRGIDWVVVGGESGAGCRPMDIQWARDIHGQCAGEEVPFFFKQIGGHPDKQHDPALWPEDLRVQEFPGDPT
jgi:protein gp37